MSPKRLLPLVMILLVLGILAVVLKRPTPPPQLAQEIGLERLVPPTLRVDNISGIDLYQGAQPQEIIRLRKRDGAWIVPSRFDAPGNSTKIQQLVTQLGTLQGELRVDSTALLDDFRLMDEQALHLKVYIDMAEQPAAHLLAGKASGANGFMRRAGEGRVYSVNVNLQSMAGLPSSATPPQELSVKPWLDLRMQNVPREEIIAVELGSPMRELRFTAQPTAAGESAASASPAPVWQLASPQLPYSVKHSAVEGLVTTLRTLQGDDVADPTKVAEYGLDAAPYRAILTVQRQGQEPRQATVLIGDEVADKSGGRYARLDGAGLIYIVPQWAWQRLFPTLGTLLELRLIEVSQDEVARLLFEQEGATWELQRRPVEAAAEASATGSGSEPTLSWHLVGAPEAPIDASAVTSLLNALAQLHAEDLPPEVPTQTGLEQPSLSLTVMHRDGRTERLLFGQAVGQEGSGYYAGRGDTAEVFIVPASTHRTLTEATAKLKPASATATPAPPKP